MSTTTIGGIELRRRQQIVLANWRLEIASSPDRQLADVWLDAIDLSAQEIFASIFHKKLDVSTSLLGLAPAEVIHISRQRRAIYRQPDIYNGFIENRNVISGDQRRPTMLYVIADIRFGSIKFEKGKVEIEGRTLAAIVAAMTFIWGGVVNYSSAKQSILEISQDASSAITWAAKNTHFGSFQKPDFKAVTRPEGAKISSFDCQSPSSEYLDKVVEEILSSATQIHKELERDANSGRNLPQFFE